MSATLFSLGPNGMWGYNPVTDEWTDLTRVDQPKPGLHHSDAGRTELKAALNLVPKSGTLRFQVLDAVVRAGYEGIARWEIVHSTGILMSSVCGRLSELERGGWIEKTGKERLQQTGQMGELYRATAKGRKAMQ